jgi:hypothetical protein
VYDLPGTTRRFRFPLRWPLRETFAEKSQSAIGRLLSDAQAGFK